MPLLSYFVGKAPKLLFVTDRDVEGDLYAEFRPETWVLELESIATAGHAGFRPADSARVETAGEDVERIHAEKGRLTYLRYLEVFFSHFFANAQCPWVPAAWLSQYDRDVMQELIERVARDPWAPADHVPILRVGRKYTAWLFGVDALECTAEEKDQEVDVILRIIRAAAQEASSPLWAAEYDAMKHGARAHTGGWEVHMTGGPPRRGPLPVPAPFGLYTKRVKGLGAFAGKLQTDRLGWDVERDLRMAKLIAMLMFNLVVARGRSGRRHEIYRFGKVDVAEALKTRVLLRHWEDGPTVAPEALTALPTDIAEVRGLAVEHLEDFTRRMDGHSKM